MTTSPPALRYVQMPELGPQVPRRGNALTRWLARTAARLTGWRFVGLLPDLPKFVVIAAPHTSNWDFPIGIMLVYAAGWRISYLGKDSLFKPPLGWLMRWLGGTPVDRSAPRGVVEESIRVIGQASKFVLVIAPEGTRKRATQWKTGFYRVALGAGLPIVLGFFDYARKEVGFGPTIWPSGDMEGDLREIQAFYRTKTARHPELFAAGE